MNVDRRLLVLGDWHWLVRDPLDVLRAVFFAGTVAFAIMGRSTAVGLTAASLVLLLSRIINVPRRFDLGVIIAMTLIAWGTALSLYGRFDFYDTIVHGVAPLFYAPVLYVCLVRLGVLADPEQTTAPREHLGVLVSTLALGMAVTAGYEVIEWLSDSLAGTHFVESVDDTGRDLLAGTLGSLVGGAFLAVWSISSWTSRRVTYRAVPAPDTRGWRRRPRAIVRRGRGRIERTGPAALVAAGLAAVAFGVVVAVWPDPTVRTLARLFGIYGVGYGVLRLVAALRGRGRTVGLSLVVESLVVVGVGIAILTWPRISADLLFHLMAITMVVGGLAGAALASVLELGVRDRILLGTAAGISMVLGIVVLAWPGDAVSVLRWLIAVQALLAGPVLVVAALRARRHAPHAAPSAADTARRAASRPEVEPAE